MRNFRIPSPVPLLLLLAAIIIVGLASCGVTNKSRSTSSVNIDSSKTEVKKESQTVKADNTVKKESSETQNESGSVTDSGSVKAEFDLSDTGKATKPVVISRDSAGNTVIDPGGRKLKSVTDTRKRTTAASSQKAKSGSDSTVNSVQVTKNVSDSNHTNLVKKAKETDSKTFRWQPPWYAYPLVIILAVVIWKFRLYRRNRPKPVIPYSSPNDPAV